MTKEAKVYNEEKEPLKQVMLGKLNDHMLNRKIRTLPHTIHKNKCKMV